MDYETEDRWLGNYFDPFMHKHIAFMHEKEVRAVVWSKAFGAYWRNAHKEIAAKYDLPPPRPAKFNGDENPDGDEIDDSDLNPPAGIGLSGDLDRLIDHIVVSPDSQAWVVDAIADYCESAVGKKVVLSKLKSGPFF